MSVAPIVTALPLEMADGIQSISTSILQRHPRNPRLIKDERFKQLCDSLEAEPNHMQARPLVVTTDGFVVAGNMRLEAAKVLGWETVPAWVEDFGDDEPRMFAFMLRDNQEFGEWVPDQLAQMVYEIAQSDVSTALTGFDDDVVRRILMSVSGDDVPGVGEEDVVPDAAEGEPDSQRGIVYPLGPHRMMCGDSLDPRQVERLLDGEQLAMIFTSPPYAAQREYGGDQDLSPERLARFLDVWAPHCSGPICVNLGLAREQHKVVRYWDTYIDAAEEYGLSLYSWNVWDRERAWSIGQQVAEFPIDHEWVLVFDTQKRTLNKTIPNRDAGKRGGGQQRQASGKMKSGANKRSSMGIRKTNPFRAMGTVYRGKPEHTPTGHPAPFPISIAADYMLAITDEGDFVADPFCGAGTLIMAAHRTGRVGLGMEIEPKYVDLARSRYERGVQS